MLQATTVCGLPVLHPIYLAKVPYIPVDPPHYTCLPVGREGKVQVGKEPNLLHGLACQKTIRNGKISVQYSNPVVQSSSAVQQIQTLINVGAERKEIAVDQDANVKAVQMQLHVQTYPRRTVSAVVMNQMIVY